VDSSNEPCQPTWRSPTYSWRAPETRHSGVASNARADSETGASLRKQKLQVFKRQALGETLLPKHVVRQLGLLALQRAHFFFNAPADQQAIGHHFAHLTDAVGAVNGLLLHRRIPPRIKQHDVGSGRKVQPESAGLE